MFSKSTDMGDVPMEILLAMAQYAKEGGGLSWRFWCCTVKQLAGLQLGPRLVFGWSSVFRLVIGLRLSFERREIAEKCTVDDRGCMP